MEILIFGAGYVGLATAGGLASTGNHVIVADTLLDRVQLLQSGKTPFFEPHLPELLESGRKKRNLEFIHVASPGFRKALEASEFCFIAVGTPEAEDGSTDLSYVFSVVDLLCEHPTDLSDKTVIMKSTVPVGTGDELEKRFQVKGKRPMVVSNPEFLKQGNAVQDFLKPERVIIGTNNLKARESLGFLYKPFMLKRERIVFMNRRSAELVKYACNAFLATKISFVNELSQFAEKCGADIREVREGMITDSRIGDQFLFPGIGFGGSCFPKDVYSLIHQGQAHQMELQFPKATREVNGRQKLWPLQKLKVHLGDLKGKRICLWGLAFKPNTDDLREAPSVLLIRNLTDEGATVSAYDPVASENMTKLFPELVSSGKLSIHKDAYQAADAADALVLVTEWQEFRTPNFKRLKSLLKTPVIIDGRNIYEAEMLKGYEFQYSSVGVGKL